MPGETKEERRARRATKRALQDSALPEVETVAPAPVDTADDEIVEDLETKEQRRERRRLKKLMRLKESSTVEIPILAEKTKRKKRRKQ